VLFTGRGVPEGQRDASAFALADTVVNGFPQELVVRQPGPLRATRPRAVKRELDGIEQRRLAGAIDASEQNDPPPAGVARRKQRGEVERLFAMEEAEVP
jgi:hypothetical protein